MKQQNVELLQTLYEEYQGALRYTATRIGVNSDDVDDVIQDSFCAFIKAYGDTIDQWEIARQKGAIMRILKNRCVDYFRIKSRRGVSISLDEGYYGKEVPLPESLIGKDVLDQMAEEDEVNYITKYLQDMKPEWRDVAILHFIEERPISEVSQILGIKEASCRMRLTRLRRYLKIFLTKSKGAWFLCYCSRVA